MASARGCGRPWAARGLRVGVIWPLPGWRACTGVFWRPGVGLVRCLENRKGGESVSTGANHHRSGAGGAAVRGGDSGRCQCERLSRVKEPRIPLPPGTRKGRSGRRRLVNVNRQRSRGARQATQARMQGAPERGRVPGLRQLNRGSLAGMGAALACFAAASSRESASIVARAASSSRASESAYARAR